MRPTLTAFALFLGVAAGVVCPKVSLASDSSASSTVGEARAHEGAEALEKGDFEGARLAYAQAYAVDPQPGYLWNLAVAESKGGHALEAIGHVRIFLQALPAAPGGGDDRQKAEAVLAEQAAHVGHVRVEAPDGARIAVDGGPSAGVSPLPAPIDVSPGRHTVEARFGAETASTVVSPGPGETVVWQLQFERVRAPAPRAVVVARTPVAATAQPTRKPPASARWVASAGLIVGGLTSLAIAGGFLAASSDENSKWAVLDLQTGYCPQPPSTAQCASLKKAADVRATDQNVAVGFGVASGALVVAGVLTFIVWPERHHEAPPSSFAPLVAPGFAGAQWTGRF
jgi:hypothetical protein